MSVFVATPSFASNNHTLGFAECQDFFMDSVPFDKRNQLEPVEDLLELCYEEFAVLYSTKLRAPLMVFERLNPASLQDASEIERDPVFYEEVRLEKSVRASLKDFERSGWDRGHLAPAADMATLQGSKESNHLTNIIAQAPDHNRKLWKKVEMDTRKYVRRARGDVYIVTGALFGERHQTLPGGRVGIPDFVYKVVQDKSGQKSWAHISANKNETKMKPPVSLNEFEALTHIKL